MAKHLTNKEKFDKDISKLNLTPEKEFVVRQTNELIIAIQKLKGVIGR